MGKIWSWNRGRQPGCKYFKFTLWSFKIRRFGCDCHILYYYPRQVLPYHKDPVEGGRHYRLNIGFGNSQFFCDDLIWSKCLGLFSMFLFRPDICGHSVHVRGRTIKLSIGWVLFDKKEIKKDEKDTCDQ